MFKNNRALALALLFVSAPLACGFGTASAARLKSSLRARNASRFAPVQGYLNAEDTQVLAKPAMADVPAALVCLPPLLLPPEPADAAVVPIPPPPPPSNPLHWPPYADQFELFDLAWRPRNMEPLKSHLVCKTVDAEVDRFWTHAAPPLSLVCNVLLNMVDDVTLPLRVVFSIYFFSSYLSRRVVRFVSFRVLWMQYYAYRAASFWDRSIYRPVFLSFVYARFVAVLFYIVSLATLDFMLLIINRLGATVLLAPLVTLTTIRRLLVTCFTSRTLDTPVTSRIITVLSAGIRTTAPSPPSTTTVPLYVETPFGKTLTIPDAEWLGSIATLTDKIMAIAGVSGDQVRLHFKGKPLDASATLAQCGICKEDTVRLTGRLDGGMPSPGAGPSSTTHSDPMSVDDLKAKKKAERHASEQASKRQKVDQAAAKVADQECKPEGRAELRKEVAKRLGPKKFAAGPPTLTTCMEILTDLSRLLELQDDMRNGQGGLIPTLFRRADPICSLARDKDGNPDVRAAGQKILPHVLSCYDYVMAMIGDDATVQQGRDASNNSDQEGHEAPPHPRSEGGYQKLRDAILGAWEERETFWAWCEETYTDEEASANGMHDVAHNKKEQRVKRLANARESNPAGDIVLPPLVVSGQARESKSFPTLALIGLVQHIPMTKTALSVAPYKLAALDEINAKIKLMGWKSAGITKVESTRNKGGGDRDAPIPDSVIDAFAEADLFTFSHDQLRDVQIYDRVIRKWKNDGYAVITFHDEADTLIKALSTKKKDATDDTPPRDTILDKLRESYSPYFSKTVLIGATLLATLQEKSLWGSQLLPFAHDHLSDLQPDKDDHRPNLTMTIMPLRPSKGAGTLYIGLEAFKNFEVEPDATNPNLVEVDNIYNAILANRPERVAIETDYWTTKIAKYMKDGRKRKETHQETTKEGQSREAVRDPDTQDHLKSRNGNLRYYLETVEQAVTRYDQKLAEMEETLRAAVNFDVHAPVPHYHATQNAPMLPKGICTPWLDELGFAMITQRIKMHLSEPFTTTKGINMMDDGEDHLYNKTLVLSPTRTTTPQDADPAGGLLGYGRQVINLAKKMQKPTAVLIYTSTGAGTVAKAVGNGVEVKPKKPKPKKARPSSSDEQQDGEEEHKQEGNSVKLIIVHPKQVPYKPDNNDDCSDDEDEGVTVSGYNPNPKFTKTWEVSPLEVHGSARDALKAAHYLMADNCCADEIKNMNVVIIGYDLFSAALTLSVSELELPPDGGVAPQGSKKQRVHYIPKSIVFCTVEDKNPSTQYQMLGRCMNTLLAFKPCETFEVDVLSHENTLADVKLYYGAEKFLIRLWQGEKDGEGRSGRIPYNLLSALKEYVHRQSITYPRAKLLLRKLGYRKIAIGDMLRGGNAEIGGGFVDEEDFSDEDEDEVVSVNHYEPEDTEPEPSTDEKPLCDDIMGWKKCIGYTNEDRWEQVLQNSGPKWTEPSTETWNPTAVNALVAKMTLVEKKAIGRDTIPSDGTRMKGKVYVWLANASKFKQNYRDLVERVMPAYFQMLCKLVMVHRFSQAMNSGLIKEAKQVAYTLQDLAMTGLKYLIYTNQFNPNGEGEMFFELRQFASELGKNAAERKASLQHMFRALRWMTMQGPTDDHADTVVAVSALLNRVMLVRGTPERSSVGGAPWNLPVFPTKIGIQPTMQEDSALDEILAAHTAYEGEDEYPLYAPYHLKANEVFVKKAESKKAAKRQGCLPNIAGQFKIEVMRDLEAVFAGLGQDVDSFTSALTAGSITATSSDSPAQIVSRIWKGLYVCLKVSQKRTNSAWGIATGTSVVQLMKARKDHMTAAGTFTKVCSELPTKEAPYAFLPRNAGNHNAVGDWKTAFDIFVAWSDSL